MIVYRVQASTGPSWVTHYEPTLDKAVAVALDLAEIYGAGSTYVDEINLSVKCVALCEFLNHADANRTAGFTGEEVFRR